MQNQLLAALIAFLMVSGCASNGPGLDERGNFVVHTPEYADNRVFYLATENPGAEVPLRDTISLEADKSPIKHSDPLSIIVNGVRLPSGPADQTRDIALIVDVATMTNGASQSIVVWYQRNVPSDATLNFANLLIHHEGAWDDRVAPLIRIRVMDVAAERNLETRETLSQVARFAPIIGAAIPNPIVNPILDTAIRAASLVLAGRQNKMLLDYTVQFYSKEQIDLSFGSRLTPLRKGRFLLIGRPNDSKVSFWESAFAYNDRSGLLQIAKSPVGVPFVLMTVTIADAIVPNIVAARSAYLQKLITDATQANVSAMEEESRKLDHGVRVLAAMERVRRYRTNSDLQSAYVLASAADKPDNPMPPEDKAVLFRMLSRVSGCPLLSVSALDTWWSAIGESANFDREGSFKLDTHGKCS